MSISTNAEGIVRGVIVIGASSGGIAALSCVRRALPSDLPAFIGIVIHRGASPALDWSRLFQATASIRGD